MTETSEFLIKNGGLFLFVAVFLDHMAVPFPAPLWILAAGALSATGKFNPLLGIGITVLACLVGDTFWFYLGRHRGNQVLGFLCRISLEPDSCVRRTQNLFTRYGMRSLIVAKFVPGLSTVAPPLAGMSRVKAGRFLIVDGFGSLLYGVCYIGLGFLFSDQIQQISSAITRMSGSALTLILGSIALYIGYKYWRRRSLLRELRIARITVAELRQKQIAGENLVILDLRSGVELEQEPSVIQGAVLLAVSDVEKRHHEFPRDRDIIIYCSCPNEVSSARVALLFHRKGIKRVRPLLGGIDAWKALKYPLERVAPVSKVTQ